MKRSPSFARLFARVEYIKLSKNRWRHLALPAAMVLAIAAAARVNATNYYVSPSGNNKNGTSYTTAWSSFNKIDWSKFGNGDILLIDGGKSGLTYNQSLVVPANLPPNIQILASNDSGHNGKVILDGKNSINTGIDISSPVCVGATGPALGMLVRNFKATGVQFEQTSGGASIWFTEVANNYSGVKVSYGSTPGQPISRLNGAYPSSSAAAFLTNLAVHDNTNYNVYSGSSSVMVGSWLYGSNYPAPSQTTVGALMDYINAPNSPSVYGCVFGPGLTDGLVAGPNCSNFNIGDCLFINAANANVYIQSSQNDSVWLKNCTSFLTKLNAQLLGHYSILDQGTNPPKGSLYVSSSIVYGGIVGIPASVGSVVVPNGYGGPNFQYSVTGNTTALAAQQVNPQFSSNVASIPYNVTAQALLNYNFGLSPKSPAGGAGAAINSGPALEQDWASQWSYTPHPGTN
jgi:hypothetical protein